MHLIQYLGIKGELSIDFLVAWLFRTYLFLLGVNKSSFLLGFGIAVAFTIFGYCSRSRKGRGLSFWFKEI